MGPPRRAAARRGGLCPPSRGASNHNGLSLNLGVETNELALVAFNGALMGSNLGGVLVVDDAQLERVGLVLSNVIGCSVCVHWFAMSGVWSGFGWLWEVNLVLTGN
jgi:hypothetical protein